MQVVVLSGRSTCLSRGIPFRQARNISWHSDYRVKTYSSATSNFKRLRALDKLDDQESGALDPEGR
uniref:Uncharacterized protein n=1 Tax=Globisporangium ultimum (strain ATCC 200006 / CBS 805.95 / DAOM BR144) TaxID=431595 RepID=K3XD80_GLOUD